MLRAEGAVIALDDIITQTHPLASPHLGNRTCHSVTKWQRHDVILSKQIAEIQEFIYGIIYAVWLLHTNVQPATCPLDGVAGL